MAGTWNPRHLSSTRMAVPGGTPPEWLAAASHLVNSLLGHVNSGSALKCLRENSPDQGSAPQKASRRDAGKSAQDGMRRPLGGRRMKSWEKAQNNLSSPV